jgi:trk system potassium uptake protein
VRGRFTLYFLGVGCAGLTGLAASLAVVALALGEPLLGFVLMALIAGVLAAPLLHFGSREMEPGKREAVIGVLLIWLVLPLLGAIPFAVSGGMSPLDAFFESMSGFTTTGATVLRDFEAFPLSLFLWRALSQWLGGIGIIVLFIAVLPQLALAGRQLFFAEMPGPTHERLTPRLRSTANAVLFVYVALTLLATISYWLAGMPFFDALAHGLTTPATGGFSTNARNLAGYASPALVWLASAFMFLSGINFALLYRALIGRPSELYRDAEFRGYLVLALVATAFVGVALLGVYEPALALRYGLFEVLSILSTAGFVAVDFTVWPERAQAILVAMMFIGGSAGSAAGGIKVARWLIVAKTTAREVERVLHPRAVLPIHVGGRTVTEEVLRAVAAFVILFLALTAFTALALLMLGSDGLTALTAAIACIANIGPGLGVVGSAAVYADFDPMSKALLVFGMYAGRLEIITVFLIFNRDFWRTPRLGWFYKPRSPLHK